MMKWRWRLVITNHKLKPKTISSQWQGPKYPIDLNNNDEMMPCEEGSKCVDSSDNVTEQNESYPEHSVIIETPR